MQVWKVSVNTKEYVNFNNRVNNSWKIPEIWSCLWNMCIIFTVCSDNTVDGQKNTLFWFHGDSFKLVYPIFWHVRVNYFLISLASATWNKHLTWKQLHWCEINWFSSCFSFFLISAAPLRAMDVKIHSLLVGMDQAFHLLCLHISLFKRLIYQKIGLYKTAL